MLLLIHLKLSKKKKRCCPEEEEGYLPCKTTQVPDCASFSDKWLLCLSHNLLVRQDKNKCSYQNWKEGFTTNKPWCPALSLSFFLSIARWNSLENHPQEVFLSKDRPQQQSTTFGKPSSSSCLICFLFHG